MFDDIFWPEILGNCCHQHTRYWAGWTSSLIQLCMFRIILKGRKHIVYRGNKRQGNLIPLETTLGCIAGFYLLKLSCFHFKKPLPTRCFIWHLGASCMVSIISKEVQFYNLLFFADQNVEGVKLGGGVSLTFLKSRSLTYCLIFWNSTSLPLFLWQIFRAAEELLFSKYNPCISIVINAAWKAYCF